MPKTGQKSFSIYATCKPGHQLRVARKLRYTRDRTLARHSCQSCHSWRCRFRRTEFGDLRPTACAPAFGEEVELSYTSIFCGSFWYQFVYQWWYQFGTLIGTLTANSTFPIISMESVVPQSSHKSTRLATLDSNPRRATLSRARLVWQPRAMLSWF
eukprot:2632492-Rhodomonas_salina.1